MARFGVENEVGMGIGLGSRVENEVGMEIGLGSRSGLTTGLGLTEVGVDGGRGWVRTVLPCVVVLVTDLRQCRSWSGGIGR